MGDLEGALEAFLKSHEILRGEAAEPAIAGPSAFETTRAKLVHDIEQFTYLDRNGRGNKFAERARNFEAVLQSLPDDLPVGQRIRLSPEQREMLGSAYNSRVYRAEADVVAAGAVLTGEALSRLRRFCLESTIWYDFRHSEGYLGAYRDDGFVSPLILQIAEELRHALPDVIRGLPARHMWAYKYDSDINGIATHADFAAVNVNFWITPDDANLEPDAGGLIVHKAECPPDWTFRDYNSADKTKVNTFIRENSAGSVVVPHRQNRAVIFNSDLFHATDTIRFREGYENRRINVTILYGDRNFVPPESG